MEDGEREARDPTCPRQMPGSQAMARLAAVGFSYVPLLIRYLFRNGCP